MRKRISYKKICSSHLGKTEVLIGEGTPKKIKQSPKSVLALQALKKLCNC